MNYFNGSENAGFWMEKAGFRRVLVWVFGGWQDGEPSSSLPP
jgi:hypothetical protein